MKGAVYAVVVPVRGSMVNTAFPSDVFIQTDPPFSATISYGRRGLVFHSCREPTRGSANALPVRNSTPITKTILFTITFMISPFPTRWSLRFLKADTSVAGILFYAQ